MNNGSIMNPLWIDMDTLETIDGKSYSLGYEDGFRVGAESNAFRWNVAVYLLLGVAGLLGFAFGMGCR
jgi:hypothetical protein